MRKPTKPGKIIIPTTAQVHPHELVVAKILVTTGHDVVFRPCRILPNADIRYRSIIWEIKSPTGSSSRTIENNLRCALKQSSNIILDLHRIKIPHSKCLLYLSNHLPSFRTIKRLLIITATDEILELSPKTGKILPFPY